MVIIFNMADILVGLYLLSVDEICIDCVNDECMSVLEQQVVEFKWRGPFK